MHVLFVPSWYQSIDNPIGGVFFRDQALALQKAGYQVGVLVAPKIRSKRQLVEVRRFSDIAVRFSIEDDLGLPTYRTCQWGWFPGFLPNGNLRLLVRAGLGSFVQYVNANGFPDVVHAHGILYGGYLGVQIHERWHIPTVLTGHASALMNGTLRPDQREVVQHTLHNTDKILAVGPALARSLNKYCPECIIEVLGNMVDTEFFIPGKDDVPLEPFIFSAVANLLPVKGFDILVKAFALAFRDEPVRLRIGGSGGERDSLERLAHELGIANQTEFLGSLTREEVRVLLQSSHALVSSSYIETFGVTLIEAMAVGKPVVATRSGGPEEIVNAMNGLLAPAGDTEALAAAMQQMVRNYKKYDPIQIRTDCAARYGERAIVEKLGEIYHSLVSTKVISKKGQSVDAT